jgi:multidrug efflux pump subunit AcrA (membrane-fusion protein)
LSAVRPWRPPHAPAGGSAAATSDQAAPGTIVRERVTPRWPGLVLVASCAGAIAAGVLALGPPGGTATRERIVTAQRGVVQSTVSGSGTLQAVTAASANFRTGGQVSHVYVKEGQYVASGQPLAQVDPTSANANLAAAEANLESANAKLAQVESGTSTSQSTGTTAARGSGGGQQAGGATTTATSPPTAADVASANAAVAAAQASVASAQNAVAETTLRAPVSGTVTSINGQVGDVAGAGGGGSSAAGASGGSSSSGSSTGSSAAGGGATGATGAGNGGAGSSSASSGASSAFISIANLGHLQLDAPLSESDIHRVRVSQSASVTVNAVPGEKLAAHVTAIASLPTTTNGVVSYPVTLALDQSAAGLRPGMTASVQLVVSQVDGVVTVPTSAVARRGPTATVTVVKGGRKSVQPVVTGVTGDSTVEIVSGLDAGEQVAIAIPTGTSGGATPGAGLGGGGLRGGFGGGFGGGGGGGGGFRFGGGGGPGGPPG